MTNEEILKLAREAGFDVHPRKGEIRAHPDVSGMMIVDLTKAVSKFAALVCAANAPKWQPIETAPAEGQYLVYMPEDKNQPIQVAHFRQKVKLIGNRWNFEMKPATHWMPLPEFKEDA